ncbi:hypothetical protein [Motiliproteus sp. MSK22-1]|uniref:hypothetical protein n=1 Tax=Motiliproteus sp. MSK22-1 TaxID=1897630 RepID=UPI0009781E4F|nr:hypothetical protein [Motiliproteus sp. MSK22-1]OMH30553.1 hypothetical protein BGP75_17620 [Motiliproteus sp. MSK22-1]
MTNKSTKFGIALLVFVSSSTVYGACENKAGLLTKPQAEETVQCIHSIHFSLGRKQEIDEEFTHEFIKTLLPIGTTAGEKLGDLSYFDVRYGTISEIISLLDSQELIAAYIDFVIDSSGSADENISFGIARLYTLQAPAFLENLKMRTDKEQSLVIGSLAWGLANNFYPHIESENYQRLIVGEHWELINSNPRSPIQLRIESAVLDIINAY